MSEPINYKDWTGIKAFLAKVCDKNGDGKLEKTADFDEISIFNTLYSEQVQADSSTSLFDYYIIRQDAIKDTRPQVLENTPQAPVSVEDVLDVFKEKMDNKIDKTDLMIKTEAEKRGVELKDSDIKYWSERIKRAADDYNIPEALLVSIIGQETNGKFGKNINSKGGAGPMQITKITVQDFFPEAKGSWHGIYKNMNEKLLNDILYKKDEEGNLIKDKNGNYILKYRSAAELRDACAKDDELGIKAGLLCFEMKYVKAVAEKVYGRATYNNIPKTIEDIKSGKIDLTEIENKSCITTALKNYNSVFKSYAPAIIDSLKAHGFNFNDLYFIK